MTLTYGVILYGPPAAGKDTVTDALQRLDSRYVLFARLKAGKGRTGGYRMTTEAALNDLRTAGEIVWENRRYGAVYVVDRQALIKELAEHVPVLHLGQVEAIDAVTNAAPGTRWLVVYLWCPREVAASRIVARGTRDVAARLRAWDETPAAPNVDLTVNTAVRTPAEAANEIHHLMSQARHEPGDDTAE